MADESQAENNTMEDGDAQAKDRAPPEDQAQTGDDRHNSIEDVEVELTVVLGKSTMPIEHLLRMGRGAIIELETLVEDDVWILVNNQIIARGQVMISGERLAVAITESLTPADYSR